MTTARIAKLAQAYRVAVYFSPAAGTAWSCAGDTWLGRRADGTRLATPVALAPGLLPARFGEMTAAPRRYGWHATLKAPFRLAAEVSTAAFVEQIRAIARSHHAFDLDDMSLRLLDGFLALMPVTEPAAMRALAADCVTRLDPCAAALEPGELAHRRGAGLEPDAERLLVRWGYPWVLERFRFHMSLSGSLDALSGAERALMMRTARSHFAGLGPCRIDALSLFAEPTRGADLVQLERVQLGTGVDA